MFYPYHLVKLFFNIFLDIKFLQSFYLQSSLKRGLPITINTLEKIVNFCFRKFLDLLEISVLIDFGIAILLLVVYYLSELISLKLVYHMPCLMLLP